MYGTGPAQKQTITNYAQKQTIANYAGPTQGSSDDLSPSVRGHLELRLVLKSTIKT